MVDQSNLGSKEVGCVNSSLIRRQSIRQLVRAYADTGFQNSY